jgi:hypothetical protein
MSEAQHVRAAIAAFHVAGKEKLRPQHRIRRGEGRHRHAIAARKSNVKSALAGNAPQGRTERGNHDLGIDARRERQDGHDAPDGVLRARTAPAQLPRPFHHAPRELARRTRIRIKQPVQLRRRNPQEHRVRGHHHGALMRFAVEQRPVAQQISRPCHHLHGSCDGVRFPHLTTTAQDQENRFAGRAFAVDDCALWVFRDRGIGDQLFERSGRKKRQQGMGLEGICIDGQSSIPGV